MRTGIASKDRRPGQPEDLGVTTRDNRRFINADRWIGKTSAPWRDLSEVIGLRGSGWKRFNRWARNGANEMIPWKKNRMR